MNRFFPRRNAASRNRGTKPNHCICRGLCDRFVPGQSEVIVRREINYLTAVDHRSLVRHPLVHIEVWILNTHFCGRPDSLFNFLHFRKLPNVIRLYRDFYDFCERCELAGIKVPIVAGIMPITTSEGMVRMAELAAGARIPGRLLKAIARTQNDEYVEKVGIHWATEQVRDLLDNDVRGIHFYTLNSSSATLKIYESLGVTTSNQLAK